VVIATKIDSLASRAGQYVVILLFVGLASIVLVISVLAHGALRRVNEELTARAKALAASNNELQVQIEKRSNAEDSLRQAQKMQALGQLTGGIAHDFNNLLQALTGSFELIKMKSKDEKILQWVDRGLQAGERATRLTSQLLAFSRIQKLNLRATRLADLIAPLQGLLSTSLGPNYRLITQVENPETELMVDSVQLELALINLAINARDAMPEGGDILIQTSLSEIKDDYDLPNGTYVCISVSDTGEGMTKEVAQKAFEPFFTTKGVGKGTGLGLSMVYGMAEQSGGRAEIESHSGRGTTIRILLPRSAEHANAALDSHMVEPRVVSKKFIMLVDDDDDVRAAASSMLEALGHDVFSASDGASALAWLRTAETQPDHIVLDFAMPGMNGAEVAQAITDEGRNIPILFASGFADTSAFADLTNQNYRLLRKPFTIQALAAEIGQAPDPSVGSAING
jgi:signal transduction histidine kinase/ActR/RegA family two-component response regulator